MHILVLHCLISEYWHIVLGYTCSPYKNCKFTHWKFFHPITLWNAMTVWSSSKMWDWHVGCWLPPKMGCKSCKVLLKTDLVVASTVRRHWSSKTRPPNLYTCRDVIAYRLSNHASTCQRCDFFQLQWLQLLLQAQNCPQMNKRTFIRRQRGNRTRQCENDVFLGDITWPHPTPRSQWFLKAFRFNFLNKPPTRIQ